MKYKSNDECMAEIKACTFFGTMAAGFMTGLALIGDATVSQIIGWALCAFVLAFMVAMAGCSKV